ncbi:TIGR03862 family flavoprotein [Sediminicoccus rosea]|uniref:TIGR03862 family flavoprotein n=1 Tax=Sediminicoccus rosea TaxID=1225128 RepID=A0ABZ0PNW2_9PROT|nr:TIGR03862 family flavoprotein [Sediminicoccus rosea]WPB87419.1 TIGR03862 family flavoprotein [Sediminicoccus rosea]
MSAPFAVIGAGPAGLMAAETLAAAGHAVVVFDQMAAPARKFLLAGRGGLNLTHSEPLEPFLTRYGAAADLLRPAIEAFPPAALIAWAEGLGQEVFTGSSGRVFPRAMKASPLLRAWLARLEGLGVTLRRRHRWLGWDGAGALRFATPEGEQRFVPRATILALGGASWPRLGSDGAWAALLPGVTPFRPANMGFRVEWSAHLRERFAGEPLKRVALTFAGETRRGEAMITRDGIEGGLLYAASAALREAIARDGFADITLDLRPDLRRVTLPGGSQSLANQLRKQARLSPVAVALVQEALRAGAGRGPAELVKALPLRLTGTQGLERAISSAGGLAFGHGLAVPGHERVFACGEMLDWEAPTGGYLLQACFSTAVAAARVALGVTSARSG